MDFKGYEREERKEVKPIVDQYYIVDVTSLKDPKLFRKDLAGRPDAAELIDRTFYGDYENTDIILGEDARRYGLNFIESGKSQWMGGPRIFSVPVAKIDDPLAAKIWRKGTRAKLRKDFRNNLPSFIKFLRNNQSSYIRTFRDPKSMNYYFMVNSLPNYIKPLYYKSVMDCLILNPEIYHTSFKKVKIFENEETEPVPCSEFFKLLKNNLNRIVKLNRYHPSIISYEKLGLTVSRYGTEGTSKKTESILSL